jgi:hypothetical protein
LETIEIPTTEDDSDLSDEIRISEWPMNEENLQEIEDDEDLDQEIVIEKLKKQVELLRDTL